MYVWIWRHLPGRLWAKLAGSAVLLAGVLALLFLVVFPYVEPRLPFNRVTVTDEEGTVPTPTASPS